MFQDAVKIFISFSRKDEITFKEFEIQFRPLVANGKVAIFHQDQVDPGEEIEARITREINESDIIIFLVSASLLAFNQMYLELEIAKKKQYERTAVVIPIILSACDWREINDFGRLNVLPRNGGTINFMQGYSNAFESVFPEIKKIIDSILKLKASKINYKSFLFELLAGNVSFNDRQKEELIQARIHFQLSEADAQTVEKEVLGENYKLSQEKTRRLEEYKKLCFSAVKERDFDDPTLKEYLEGRKKILGIPKDKAKEIEDYVAQIKEKDSKTFF